MATVLNDANKQKQMLAPHKSITFNRFKTVKGMNRRVVEVNADRTSISAGGNFTFKVPAFGILNNENSHPHLKMTVTTSKTGGTYSRVSLPAYSIISRCVIKCGTTVLYDNDAEGLWDAIQVYSDRSQAWILNEGLYHGVDSTSNRNTDYAAGKALYLDLGVIDFLTQPYPAYKNDNSAELTIKFYLANASDCVETDGTTPTLVVDTPKLILDYVDLSNDQEMALRNQKTVSGVVYNNIKRQEYILPASTTTQSINLNHRCKDLTAIVVCARIDGNLGDVTSNDKFTTWELDDLHNMKLKINNKSYVFEEGLDTSVNGQAFEEFKRFWAWDKEGNMNRPDIAESDFFADSRFLGIINLSAFKHSHDANVVLSGVSLDRDAHLELSFGTATPSQLNLSIFYVYKSMLTWKDGIKPIVSE